MILVSAHGHHLYPPSSSLSFGWLHHHTETALSKATRSSNPPASFISHLGFHPSPTSVLPLPLRGLLLSPLCGLFSGKFCAWPWSLHWWPQSFSEMQLFVSTYDRLVKSPSVSFWFFLPTVSMNYSILCKPHQDYQLSISPLNHPHQGSALFACTCPPSRSPWLL